jgi:hypothetical protein
MPTDTGHPNEHLTNLLPLDGPRTGSLKRILDKRSSVCFNGGVWGGRRKEAKVGYGSLPKKRKED